MANYDAVLIPGGGVRAGGALPPWVPPRLDLALQADADFLLPLSAGTPHRPPPLDEYGFPWTEARAGARYLVEHGADPARILMEESSFDTIGNAYFSLLIHAIPRGFERLLVVTSAFHMPRTEAAFRWVYGVEGNRSLEFLAAPDTGIDAADLAARAQKEQESLRSLEALRARIRTLADLHLWMFTAHQAYAWNAERRRPAVRAPLY